MYDLFSHFPICHCSIGKLKQFFNHFMINQFSLKPLGNIIGKILAKMDI